MFGPCPRRRRSGSSARTSAASRAASSTNELILGFQARSLAGLHGSGRGGARARATSVAGALEADSDSLGLGPLDFVPSAETHPPEPVKLVGKPQPRARARPPAQVATPVPAVSGGSSSPALASTDAPAEHTAVTSSSASSGTAAGAAPPSHHAAYRATGAAAAHAANAANAAAAEAEARGALEREDLPLGPRLKTTIVRSVTRKLQERAAQLADVIPGPGAARPPPFTPRLPQMHTAHSNYKMRQDRIASRKEAGKAGDGLDVRVTSTSDDESGSDTEGGRQAAASVAAGGWQYGRPPVGAKRGDEPGTVTARSSAAAVPEHVIVSPTILAATAATSAAAVGLAGLVPVPGAGERPAKAELEATIRGCADLEAVRTLYGRLGGVMSRSELILLVNTLAGVQDPQHMTVKVWTQTQAMLVELLQRITPRLDSFTMQDFMVVLAAVAKLRYVPPNDWIAAVLTQSKTRLYNATPAQLTTGLRALARMTVDPSDIKSAAAWEAWMRRYLASVQRQLAAYRADELVKTLVSLSELRYRPPPDWMARFSAALHNRLDVLEAHSLSEAMLAFAALRYQPEAPFLRAYYGQLYSRLPLADDRDMATFAQAAALLDRLVRQDFMQEFLAEVLQKLPTFKPQHLANLLNAMGRLAAAPASRVRPPPGWAAVVAEHMGYPLPGANKTRLSTFSGTALASAAWGLSVLGYQPTPKFLDDLLSASYGKLHACGPTDLILLLTALGNFGYTPAPQRGAFWDTWMVEFEKLAARKSYDTRGVCDLMAALARLPRPTAPNGVPRPPHPEFVVGVLRSTRIYNLRNTSPSRLAALAGSLAVVGIRPDFGFLYNYAQAARFMWSGFSMRDYAILLGSLVHIGTPGVADPRWAGDFLAITLCRMPEFDGPGLAAALEALAQLPNPEFEPSRQWLAAAAQRAGELLRNPPPPPQSLQAVAAAAATAAAAAAAGTQSPGHLAAVGGSGAAAAAGVPAAAVAAAGGAGIAVPGPVHGSLSYRAGGALANGGTLVVSPEGRLVPVPPMHPLTPEHVLSVVRSLAVLGHRCEEQDLLAQATRALLTRNAVLLKVQEGKAGGSSSGGSSGGHDASAASSVNGHVEVVPTASGLAEGKAVAGREAASAAFQRANSLAAAAAAAAAANAQGEAVRPLLSREASAQLEAALQAMLGHQVAIPPLAAPSLPGLVVAAVAADIEMSVAASAPVAPVAPGSSQDFTMPAGAVRTADVKQAQAARWAEKRNGRGGARAAADAEGEEQETERDEVKDDRTAGPRVSTGGRRAGVAVRSHRPAATGAGARAGAEPNSSELEGGQGVAAATA
ncbi:hypothetical protein HXX76_006364 [Chlamydomonas incerta]|uniref:Uncharacterized protein n=1 Tax=Chlamydomonas incerta TaxID=51695 RepID=A0A835W4J5_CHLIN|nr:hypothetical protein HXX76_006364 [Chlamydomonas incerta]|eukprot:KAG2436844.1 hypothetical protein HXX76_006364 [Chlamydomonas incerta]